VQFLIKLADFGCLLKQTQINEYARDILDQLPAGKTSIRSHQIKSILQ
jgi:hypothetical protein